MCTFCKIKTRKFNKNNIVQQNIVLPNKLEDFRAGCYSDADLKH